MTEASLVFPQANHFVSKDHYHNYFDAKIPPVVRVKPGDLVHVETHDCYHGKILPGVKKPNKVAEGLRREELNPVTGPIYVEDAQPGDWLAVHIIDIRPKGVGVACCGTHSGQLCHWMTQNTTVKFFDLSDDGKIVTMRDSLARSTAHRGRVGPIKFGASPMLGVIGVAPAGSGRIITMPAGKHGGNLDNNANGIGSTIYIPVNHPGALLSMGDMHAAQGDGEISGTGVEIGGHVLLRCEILRKQDLYTTTSNVDADEFQLQFPVTETPTHWITHGVMVENIPQATNLACEEAARLLIGQWDFTPEEAFIFLSVQGNLGLCQSCHPDQGTQIAKMTVPKLLEVCPRPFRCLQEK